MYTTYSPEGTLNNYAKEPDTYYATYPSPEQQNNYLKFGAFAFLLVTSVIFTGIAIS